MTGLTGLALAGRIATPDDSDWDQARLAWNLAADQRPVAVVFADNADDVAATVRFAAGNYGFACNRVAAIELVTAEGRPGPSAPTAIGRPAFPTRSPRGPVPDSHGPREPCLGSAKGGRFASCPTRRSRPLPPSPGRSQARRCCSASCATSAAPWVARTRAAAPSRPCDVDAILPPDVCTRLGEVKGKWDPDSRIVANHAVSLGEA